VEEDADQWMKARALERRVTQVVISTNIGRIEYIWIFEL
jgi:hypothetical protein